MLNLLNLSSYTNESSDLEMVTMHGMCGTVQGALLSLAYAGFSVYCDPIYIYVHVSLWRTISSVLKIMHLKHTLQTVTIGRSR